MGPIEVLAATKLRVDSESVDSEPCMYCHVGKSDCGNFAMLTRHSRPSRNYNDGDHENIS